MTLFGALRRRIAFAALLLAGASLSGVRADSIYYQVEKDGSIRLTNAPDEKGYHTYFATGGASGSPGGVTGLYSEQIRREAGRYGLDPNLVKAVIATESNFNPWAVSPKGARGLMQLMPSTAVRFGVKNVHDPSQNIQGGVQYLRHLLDLFGGDLVLALAAYNAGERVVQQLGRVPNYRETRDYVDRVLARYGRRQTAGAARSGVGKRDSAADRRARPRQRIYTSVSREGALVFSDSPIPKTQKD